MDEVLRDYFKHRLFISRLQHHIDVLLLNASCCILNIVTRFLNLLAGLTYCLVNFFTRFFCRAFLFLAPRQCQGEKSYRDKSHSIAFILEHFHFL